MEPGESLSLSQPLGNTRSRRDKSKNTVGNHDAKTKNPGPGNKSVHKGRGKQASATSSAQASVADTAPPRENLDQIGTAIR